VGVDRGIKGVGETVGEEDGKVRVLKREEEEE